MVSLVLFFAWLAHAVGAPELGRVSGILTNEIYAGMVIVITLTTFLPPFIMKWFYRRYGDSMPGYSGPAQAVR